MSLHCGSRDIECTHGYTGGLCQKYSERFVSVNSCLKSHHWGCDTSARATTYVGNTLEEGSIFSRESEAMCLAFVERAAYAHISISKTCLLINAFFEASLRGERPSRYQCDHVEAPTTP